MGGIAPETHEDEAPFTSFALEGCDLHPPDTTYWENVLCKIREYLVSPLYSGFMFGLYVSCFLVFVFVFVYLVSRWAVTTGTE